MLITKWIPTEQRITEGIIVKGKLESGMNRKVSNSFLICCYKKLMEKIKDWLTNIKSN